MPALTPAEKMRDLFGAVKQYNFARTLANSGLAAVGLGAAWRGAQGLANTLSGPPKRPGFHAVRVPVPYAMREDEEKLAAEKKAEGWFDNFIKGKAPSSSLISNPIAFPALAATALGGVYGGWKGVDSIMDSRYKSRIQEDLEGAKSTYEKALRDTLLLNKESEEGRDEISVALDALYDQFEKQAFNGSDVAGAAGNILSTLAIASALGGAYGGYKWHKARRESTILEKAKEKRMQELQRERPIPLYAYPSPVKV